MKPAWLRLQKRIPGSLGRSTASMSSLSSAIFTAGLAASRKPKTPQPAPFWPHWKACSAIITKDTLLPGCLPFARRKAMDVFRARRHLSLETAEEVPAETDVLQQVIRTEQIAALAGLIGTLSEEERELIRLRYVAELNFSEIARLLNRREDALKKSLHRLLARLQGQLEVSHE